MRDSEVNEVETKHRESGEGWDEEFVPPSHVEGVVQDAEDGFRGDGCVRKAV